MPREIVVPVSWDIYDKDGRQVNAGVGQPPELEEGQHIDYTPGVELNWSRDMGHVQLSIEFPREQWIANAEELKNDPQVTKRAIFTDGLSRYQINKMIKTLRRARDAAHGADE